MPRALSLPPPAQTVGRKLAPPPAADAAPPGDTTETEFSTGAPTAYVPGAEGVGDAAARGAAQGATLGFGDEINGAVQAAARKLGMGSDADKRRGLSDLYREERDSFRREDETAQKAHPFAFGAGELAGGTPLAVAAPGAGAGKLRMLLSAGALAGTTGAGESTAADTAGVLEDAGKAGAAGLALTGSVLGAAKAAPAAQRYLRQTFLNAGRRVLSGGANLASAARQPLSDAAVEAAAQAGAFRPLGTTPGAAAAVDDAREQAGTLYRNILKTLQDKGLSGPDAETLAQKLAAEGRSVATADTNPAVRGVYDKEAAALRAQEPAGDFTVSRDADGKLGLVQAEDLKRAAQRDARYGRYEETPQNEAKRAVASTYRQAVEDEIEQQGKSAPDAVTRVLSDEFVPTKQRLGNLIEAGDAAEKAVGQQLRRSGSLHKTISRAAGLSRAAAGDPMGLVQALGTDALDGFIRNRGASTLAWGADKGARALGYMTGPASTPAQLRTQAIIDALRRTALPVASEEAGARVGE